jgi:uncharacterized YccA/Bax inhibitor family protein
MIDLDLRPDTKKLRQFGYIGFFGFGIFGLLVAHKTGAWEEPGKWTIPFLLWGLAALCPILSLTAPKILTPLYIGLMIIAFPIGLIISNLVLLVIFSLFFIPLALWFRMVGRDELNRKWSPETSSYWIRYRSPADVESYYRQF